MMSRKKYTICLITTMTSRAIFFNDGIPVFPVIVMMPSFNFVFMKQEMFFPRFAYFFAMRLFIFPIVRTLLFRSVVGHI